MSAWSGVVVGLAIAERSERAIGGDRTTVAENGLVHGSHVPVRLLALSGVHRVAALQVVLQRAAPRPTRRSTRRSTRSRRSCTTPDPRTTAGTTCKRTKTSFHNECV